MEINKDSLFPINIYNIDTHIDTTNMVNYIETNINNLDLHYGNDSGGLQGGGWLIDNPLFSQLKLTLDKSIQSIFDKKSKIMDGWISICNKNDYNKIHNHPSSNPIYYDSEFISAVFYLKTNKDGGNLVIHSHQNPTNTYDYQPENGSLIIFNSSTLHSVTPNLSDFSRISFAFNIRLI